MFRKLAELLGIGAADVAGGTTETAGHAPYPFARSNALYNLLFCDQPLAAVQRHGDTPFPVQAMLSDGNCEARTVLALAGDTAEDSRIRALAYRWLREHGHAVPARKLLGVVVEVADERGLTVLAAYSDGEVRYFDTAGRQTILDDWAGVRQQVNALLFASRPAIGPCKNERLPPPLSGNLRVSFLMSDGLYLGETPALPVNTSEYSPLVAAATRLLQAVEQSDAQNDVAPYLRMLRNNSKSS